MPLVDTILGTTAQASYLWRLRIAAGLVLLLALPLAAQRPPAPVRVPVGIPLGFPQHRPELPWPTGLRKKEAVTGHIAALDKDQILIRSLDYGDVLFWVDQRTVVRVDKFLLTLEDLRVGDPVAVRLKKIKGRGPYAKLILPHPDVRARKLRGETASPELPPAGGHGGIIPPQSSTPPPAATAAGEAASAETAADTAEEFPPLPSGASGVVGTVVAVTADSLELRDREDQLQKVVLTAITLIKRAGSGAMLRVVKPGDRVAIVGDQLDTGEWIGREVLVQAARHGGSQVPGLTPAESAQAQGQPGRAEEVSLDGLARLSGVILALDATPGNEQIRLRTEKGEQVVLLTGATTVRRMGTRSSLVALKVGDEVRVVGDLLGGGLIVARQLIVTKLASR